MTHYTAVMEWIGLFLFNYGLATFSGKHSNISLLFPMEQVFEDFVAKCFSRFQHNYRVRMQSPQEYFAKRGNEKSFQLKPDISLLDGGNVQFILDTKWKHVDTTSDDKKHNISRSDVYQLYVYGKRYGCRAVALVYPKSDKFPESITYRYFDDLPLICFPFNVEDAKSSVAEIIESLHSESRMNAA